MKYLIVIAFTLLIPFLNNFVFAENEFSIETLLTHNVTSVTYNPDDENIYAAVFFDRIATIDSTTNNVTNIIKNLEVNPYEISYDPVNSALYLFGAPMTLLTSNISIIDSKNDNISKTFRIYSDSENSFTHQLLSDIAYNSNKSMYVINPWTHSVSVIDTSTYNIIKDLPIPRVIDLTFNQSNNYLYIATNGMIYVVDSSTNEVIKKIPVEGLPEHLIYNPSNDYVYVTSKIDPFNTGIVVVIDSSTNEVIKNIPVGKFLVNVLGGSATLTYNPSNNYVYVALNNSISLINSNNEIVKNITLNDIGKPLQMEYNPSNSNLYVNLNNKKIAIINSTTNNITNIIENLHGYPTGIAYNPENKDMYLLQIFLGLIWENTNHAVAIINSTTNNITNIIENLHGYPTGIAYNPENKDMDLVVQNRSHPQDQLRLLKLDPTTNNITTILKNFEDADLVSAIAYNPDNKNIYMTDIVNSTSISVIDPSTNTVIKNIPISDRNYYSGNILYSPSNGYIYATSIMNETGTLSVIDPSTNTVIKNIQVAKVPNYHFRNDMIYNPSNGYIYLMNIDATINDTYTGYVTMIDPNRNNVIKNIPIGEIRIDLGTLIHNPSNGYIYAMTIYNNDTNTHSIAVIDPNRYTVIKNIPIGETDNFFGDLIYNPSNDYVYVTSIMNETGIVSIIDSSTNNIVKNIPVGSPDFTSDRKLIYNPSNGYIYLSTDDLYVIKHKEISRPYSNY
jgi:YVTN family beta-propeller protein